MEYDSKVIEEFAARLYEQANSIVASYTVWGVIMGALGGAAVLQAIGAAVGGIAFGLSGYLWGKEKSFQLRLQAQTALCQVQLEKNTRK